MQPILHREFMYITMNSDYALRAMIEVAGGSSGEIISIVRVSEAAEIPESFLRKIIPQLRKAGLIRTIRGNHGGITLARPAASISLLDIILPIEEHLGLHRCVLHNDRCDRKTRCSVHDVWKDIENQVRHILAGHSLEQLVHRHQFNLRVCSA